MKKDVRIKSYTLIKQTDNKKMKSNLRPNIIISLRVADVEGLQCLLIKAADEKCRDCWKTFSPSKFTGN